MIGFTKSFPVQLLLALETRIIVCLKEKRTGFEVSLNAFN
jgi:hypothetical protein